MFSPQNVQSYPIMHCDIYVLFEIWAKLFNKCTGSKEGIERQQYRKDVGFLTFRRRRNSVPGLLCDEKQTRSAIDRWNVTVARL